MDAPELAFTNANASAGDGSQSMSDHPVRTAEWRESLRAQALASAIAKRAAGVPTYSVPEAAALLSVSQEYLYRLIQADGFPAVRMRVGAGQGRYVVPAKAVELLLDATRRTGRASSPPTRRRSSSAGRRWPVSSVFEHLDQAVERLAAVRDELLADPYAPGPRRSAGGGVRVRGAGVVAGLRAGEPAADLAGGAGRGGGRAGERGAVGAARRRGASRRRCRLRAGLPVGWVRPARWPSPRAAGAVVGDAERRSLDLVLDPRCGDLREGAGRGRGGRVRADRAGAVRVDPGRSGLPEAVSGFVSTVDGAATPR